MIDIRFKGEIKRIITDETTKTGGERRLIAGYASVPVVDNHKTIFTPQALQAALDEFMKNPVLRYQHKEPIGRVLPEATDSAGALYKTHVDDNGLFVVAEIAQGTQAANEAWALIQQGIINGFSIGGRVENEQRDIEYKTIDGEKVGIIKRLKLFEISVVDLPSNPAAHFQVLREDGGGALEVKRPIGPWPDFAACVEAMKAEGYDEESAKRICGALEKQFSKSEGGNMNRDEINEAVKGYLERARYPWDQCIRDQKKQGYSEEAAARICAAIKNRTVRHIVEYGLARDYAEAIEYLNKRLEDDPLFRYTIERIKDLTLTLQKYEGEESMTEEQMERQEGAANQPAPENQPQQPAPQGQPETPALADRVAALEEKMAALEGAIAELRELVNAALSPKGETGEATGEGAGGTQPVNESIERRKGANILAQASVEIDGDAIKSADRETLLRALDKAKKGVF